MGDGDEVPFDKIFKMKEEAEEASQTPDPPPPTPPPPVAPIATPFGPIPTGGQTPKADPATQYQQMQQPDEFREFAEKSGCALGTASTALLAMLAALVLLITYLLVRDDGSEKTANTATTVTTAPAATVADGRVGPPDPSTLPPGAALYQGSAGPIGCIPCDGKFRLLHPTNGGVVADVLGGPGEAGQTMVFATNGTITEFGINLTNADGGKWEFALHANGNAYVASCHIAVGSTQCKTRGLDSAPIKAGDQIAVIVGNPGDPLTQGQFNASWWIVFQPS